MTYHVMTGKDIDDVTQIVRRLGPKADRIGVTMALVSHPHAEGISAYLWAMSYDEFRTMVQSIIQKSSDNQNPTTVQ